MTDLDQDRDVDDHYELGSQEHVNYVISQWQDGSTVERAQLCKEAGVSIFAARSESIPLRVMEYLIHEA